MSSDNRTVINDCEATTGWTGSDSVTAVSNTGEFYEGSGGLSWQASNSDDEMHTTQDSVGMGTFTLDWSDVTVYLLVKDNLQNTAANGGVQFVVGDGTDLIGYDVGGNDAVGLPFLGAYFNSYKLDMSNRPASFTTHAGSEAGLTDTAITQVGYGCLHLAKANGPSDNVFMDCFRYIANGSYALTINGGTSGTPETMADVVGDDVTNGWGLVSNPVGDLYYFFGPTEWGESAASADHYFQAADEQWFWLGDNGGGHAVGATHFPFRVVGNATDTGSFVITGIVVVNTGTGAEFDCADTNIDTLEIDACSFTGLASFNAPSAGGTSRFCTNTKFQACGQITHNGASMNGCSVLQSTVAANDSAVVYNETSDPDGEMDDMVFSKGTNAHHAIEFGADIPTTITLRGMDFSGFGSSNNANDSVFHFLDTTGTITVNLVGCSHDGSGFTYRTEGATIDLVISPVTLTVTTRRTPGDGGAVVPGVNVLVTVDDVIGGLPYQDSVSITQTAGTATVSHTGHGFSTNQWVLIEGANEDEYNGAHQITVTGTNSYTFPIDSGASSPATGSPVATAILLFGLTDVNGEISDTRTYSVDQDFSGSARKKSFSPAFKDGVVTGTVDSATGAEVTINMQLDE